MLSPHDIVQNGTRIRPVDNCGATYRARPEVHSMVRKYRAPAPCDVNLDQQCKQYKIQMQINLITGQDDC
jgi:hypothetical protein